MLAGCPKRSPGRNCPGGTSLQLGSRESSARLASFERRPSRGSREIGSGPARAWSRTCAVSETPPVPLTFELLGQQVVHDLRIRLPLRSFHDLSHEKPDHGLFPGAVLLELLRIGRNDVGDDLLQ